MSMVSLVRHPSQAVLIFARILKQMWDLVYFIFSSESVSSLVIILFKNGLFLLHLLENCRQKCSSVIFFHLHHDEPIHQNLAYHPGDELVTVVIQRCRIKRVWQWFLESKGYGSESSNRWELWHCPDGRQDPSS